MEHILQFAINIDDDTIVKNVIANAEKNITKELTTQAREAIFDIYKAWDGKEVNRGTQLWVEKAFMNFLEENKDHIIDVAVAKVADKLARTKIAREALAEAVNTDDIGEDDSK